MVYQFPVHLQPAYPTSRFAFHGILAVFEKQWICFTWSDVRLKNLNFEHHVRIHLDNTRNTGILIKFLFDRSGATFIFAMAEPLGKKCGAFFALFLNEESYGRKNP